MLRLTALADPAAGSEGRKHGNDRGKQRQHSRLGGPAGGIAHKARQQRTNGRAQAVSHAVEGKALRIRRSLCITALSWSSRGGRLQDVITYDSAQICLAVIPSNAATTIVDIAVATATATPIGTDNDRSAVPNIDLVRRRLTQLLRLLLLLLPPFGRMRRLAHQRAHSQVAAAAHQHQQRKQQQALWARVVRHAA